MSANIVVNGDLDVFKYNLFRDNLYGTEGGFTRYSVGGDQLTLTYYSTNLAIKPIAVSNDVYKGVHKAHFLDGDLVVGLTGSDATVLKMYNLLLGRSADAGGLTYWSQQLDNGTPLKAVTAQFAQTAEYNQIFGGKTNDQFVTALYKSYFNVVPDQASHDLNVARLDGGWSQSDLVATFLQFSPPGVISTFVAKSNAAAVEQIYDTFLGRLPDRDGLVHWIHATDNGANLQQIADGFAQSSEFTSLYAGTSDNSYIQALYQNTLHRSGEAAGVTYWTEQLSHGHSRAEVALEFAISLEHAKLMATHISQGLEFL